MSHDIIPDSAGTALFIALIVIFVFGTFMVAFSLEYVGAKKNDLVKLTEWLLSKNLERKNDRRFEDGLDSDTSGTESIVQERTGKKWPRFGPRRRRPKNHGGSRDENEAEKAVEPANRRISADRVTV